MADPLPPGVLATLRAGKKLEAIKQLRGITGLGLKEAKEWIENHERGGVRPLEVYDEPEGRAPKAPFTLPPAALEALKRGNTVEAIQVIRRETGVGLAEAKAIAEKIRDEIPMDGVLARYGLSSLKRPQPSLAPGEVPRGGATGKWIVVVVLLLGLLAAAWHFQGMAG